MGKLTSLGEFWCHRKSGVRGRGGCPRPAGIEARHISWTWAGLTCPRSLWTLPAPQCLGRLFDAHQPQVCCMGSVVTRLLLVPSLPGDLSTYFTYNEVRPLWQFYFPGSIFDYLAFCFKFSADVSFLSKALPSALGMSHGMVWSWSSQRDRLACESPL